MPSPAIATVVKMLESLPEAVQDHVADHLRAYLADLQDEQQWDALVRKTQPQLVMAARQAKQAIAQGQATLLDYDQL
ncbi:MAG: hypothetical protein FJZ47_24535 [Candidatus Tectomicrobia bacterium]|uniref:DUF2281 domain-containing protein n=1 Tax=Tectimicrobiota bacterium TaxID=2528274 RepID=A0A937W8I2_UNCTE|nr:hypothetical protein [Candidatus Tectomicrobia bacterium]